MEKMASDGPKRDPRGFLPTNPDLANIFGRTDLDFETRSPNFSISRSPDLQIPRFPGPQISTFPDAAGAATAAPLPDELSDPNLTPLPMHPGIKYVARRPCCDHGFYIVQVQ